MKEETGKENGKWIAYTLHTLRETVATRVACLWVMGPWSSCPHKRYGPAFVVLVFPLAFSASSRLARPWHIFLLSILIPNFTAK